MSTPTLSIITPLYNRAWCIADCIASTDLKDLSAEMVIVDDGSTDGSVAVAQATIAALGLDRQVRIVEQDNAGPSIARNRAAEMARGEWLVFLDSDDLWFPWTVSNLLKVLSSADNSVDLAFTHGINFVDTSELERANNGSLETEIAPSFVHAVRLNPTSRYGACNAAVRREAFQDIGGFSPMLKCAEDTDFFLRIRGNVMLIRQPTLVALRRSGHESLTGNVPEVVRGFKWMRDHVSSGRYRGSPDDLRSFLAGSCAYSVKTAFAAGFSLVGYQLYLSHLSLLANPRTRKYMLRLPLTPLLHFYNPRAYPFRFSRRS
ncbi:MAG: glycosyltransferase family 2 protein [Paracoccaceae bacterium]